MSKTYLSILIQLAKIDGFVVKEEVDLINEVGIANGMSKSEIAECLEEDGDDVELTNFSSLPSDQKYNLIYSIVKLMKIDGKLYNEEIKFCAKMVAKLGYEENALFELMTNIYANSEMSTDKDALKQKIQEYLIL